MKKYETGCVDRTGDDTDTSEKLKVWRIPTINGTPAIIQARTFEEAIKKFRAMKID